MRTLNDFAGGRLKNPDDLGILLRLVAREDRRPLIDRSAFLAKFIVKSRKIMNRIGADADGYEQLSQELGKSLKETTELLRTLLADAPDADRERMTRTYLAMTPAGLDNLFALLEDLAWYKNWKIDHRDEEL